MLDRSLAVNGDAAVAVQHDRKRKRDQLTDRWRAPEPEWAFAGRAAAISTKCIPDFTPILWNRRTVSPPATGSRINASGL